VLACHPGVPGLRSADSSECEQNRKGVVLMRLHGVIAGIGAVVRTIPAVLANRSQTSEFCAPSR
jgi:hypothetical protein